MLFKHGTQIFIIVLYVNAAELKKSSLSVFGVSMSGWLERLQGCGVKAVRVMEVLLALRHW